MGFAEHLAVLYGGLAAFAPGGDVVGVHFGEFLDAGAVGVVADGAEGAVGEAFGFGGSCLLGIDGLFGGLIKNADVQQARLFAAAQDVLEDAFLLLDVEVLVQVLHLGCHGGGVVAPGVVLLV